MESDGPNLNPWQAKARDTRADFIKVFGKPPGALVGVALMTDADNTRSSIRAWYGPVQLGTSLQVKR